MLALAGKLARNITDLPIPVQFASWPYGLCECGQHIGSTLHIRRQDRYSLDNSLASVTIFEDTDHLVNVTYQAPTNTADWVLIQKPRVPHIDVY